MKLRYSSASPFVRKVLIMAQETGLLSRIDVLPADPFGDDLSEYLDSLHDGPKFLPANGPERWKVQQLHGLADGILDAAVGQVYEVVRRPAQYSYPQNSARLTNKINKALDYLESQVADFDAALNLGSITLVCALDYLDFRLSEAIDWRANRPSLEAWHDRLSDRPSFKQTLPHL